MQLLELEYIFEGALLVIIGITGYHIGNILFFNSNILVFGTGFGVEYISGLSAFYFRILGVICGSAGILLIAYTLTIVRSKEQSKKRINLKH